MKLKKILRKSVSFFELLQDQTRYITDSARALVSYTRDLKAVDAEEIKSLEECGDKKRLELVQALGNIFITPYDHEDIYCLSKALDDILDYFKTTVKEIEIYQIGHTSDLCNFADVLETACQSIDKAVLCMEKQPKQAMQHAIAAKKYENKAESLYRHSIAALLLGDDIKYIIKMREIYRHLSNCADRIDEAADCICTILMKEIS